MRRIIVNIGEFFTGDIAAPTAPVRSLLIEDGVIRQWGPPPDTACGSVLDARGRHDNALGRLDQEAVAACIAAQLDPVTLRVGDAAKG